MVAVTIADLVVRYGAGRAAVDGVSLAVEPRELFLLLGPSGCGKTTVLRSVAGFVTPTSGTIHFGDEDVTGLPAHARKTGMVFQSFALWPHMTVAQNVGFGLREQRVPSGEIAARVEAALDSTQMKGFGPRRIDQLSGGEQQRVALARALVVRPRCLLLDEPLASLDAKLRRSMREEIRRICKSFGLTAIYVTHDQKEALAIADRVAVMDQGRIVQVGTPEEIYRRPRSRVVAAFVGDTNLFEGRVRSVTDLVIQVDSAVGPLLAARAEGSEFVPLPNERTWISIRPECCRLLSSGTPELPAGGSPENLLRGRRSESVFLGEFAEHRLQVGGQALSVYEMNPRAPGAGAAAGQNGGEVTIAIAPHDVVLLPFDGAGPGGDQPAEIV